MSFSVNQTPQVSSLSPQVQTPAVVDNPGEALEELFAAEGEAPEGPPVVAAEDSNQAQLRESASFSPTSEDVTFNSAQAPEASSDPVPELAPLSVDPPLNELPSLENGRNVLRGDALQERLQALGTQATNGMTALSERQEQLSTALTRFPPESPEYQELTQTINDVQKAVDQLKELQGQLSSQDPKAVAGLQELLVQKDNGTAEDEPFEARLTYEKPDGSKATFDNLYGKRTDAGLRDYIARLVEETRTEGPHQAAAPVAEEQTAAPVVEEQVAAPVAEEQVAAPVAAEQAEAGPEVSLRAAADSPAVEEEIIVRPQQVTESAAPLDGEQDVSGSESLDQASAFLAVHGDVVFEFAALAAEYSRVQNAGAPDMENVQEKLNIFMSENQTELGNFRLLYDKLDAVDQKQVDEQITQGVRQFIEENPDLISLSALSSDEAKPIQLSSLYDMNWNLMGGSTLYSGNVSRMA